MGTPRTKMRVKVPDSFEFEGNIKATNGGYMIRIPRQLNLDELIYRNFQCKVKVTVARMIPSENYTWVDKTKLT